MIEWVIVAVCALIAILSGTYLYHVAYSMLTISKCPDCGRIMQKVLYTSGEDGGSTKIVYECQFCQSKRIRPIYKGRKYTMHP
ncbi:hypothetical protein [Effusibacillus dendaii]|uniref:hypothetical protein n=1 Tax=Effusibacillus dendaii TaxID=2743772 RepID=UPI00190DA236|nr:hypothetical protein [Effusibacillus dendaii]